MYYIHRRNDNEKLWYKKIIEIQIKYGMINECKNKSHSRKLLLIVIIVLLKENKTIGQNGRFSFFAPIFA